MIQVKALLAIFLIVLGGHGLANAQKPPVKQPSAKKRLITFSGLSWEVKVSSTRPIGPGPNLFSDSPNNVWVDGKGKLHLRITKRSGRYFCAEVVCVKSFGYGTYRFEVEEIKTVSPKTNQR